MQLAQECLKDPPEASEEPPAQLEGLEMFAQTIETGESKLCVYVCVCVKKCQHTDINSNNVRIHTADEPVHVSHLICVCSPPSY